MVDVAYEGPCLQNEQPKDISVQGTSVRWGSPASDAAVDKLVTEGIPKATLKQTQ